MCIVDELDETERGDGGFGSTDALIKGSPGVSAEASGDIDI